MTTEQYDDLREKLKTFGDSAKWKDPFGRWHPEYIAEQGNKRISLRTNDFSEWLCYYIDGSAVNVFSKVNNEIVTSKKFGACGKTGSHKQFCGILKKYEDRAAQETNSWLNMLEET